MLNNNLPLQIKDWTPALVGNHTYALQQGKYVKVGRLVYITGRITISQKDSSLPTGTHIHITGLPYLVISTPAQIIQTSCSNVALQTNSTGIIFRATGGVIYGYNTFNNANVSTLNPSQLSNTTDIFISVCYLTEQ